MFTQEQWVVFDLASRKVFSNWSVLRLAVDHGWGGIESRKKAEEFALNVISRFREAAFSSRTRDAISVEELADFLSEELLHRFSAEVDDDTDTEVAGILVDLFEKCGKGDYSAAEKIEQDALLVTAFRDDTHNSQGGSASSSSDDDQSTIEKPKNKYSVPDQEGWSVVLRKLIQLERRYC